MERDAYDAGKAARAAGWPDEANPYPVSGPDGDFEAHAAWHSGWASADPMSEDDD